MKMTDQSQSQRGQTLAEFALTLPLLLLLIFGIVEFGRIFQAWVTIQNAARQASRFATTGQVLDKYAPNENIYTFITCDGNDINAVPFLSPTTKVVKNFPRGQGYAAVAVNLFEDTGTPQSEHLYASWNGYYDCNRNLPETEQQVKDMLRLVSIYDEARLGATGLSIEPARVEPTAASIQNYLYESFGQPHVSSQTATWFNVVVCSSRPKLLADDVSQVLDANDLPYPNQESASRYFLYNSSDDPSYDPVACVLKEQLKANYPELTDNYGVPWQDPGGAGELVTVVVSFNHPLITPINLNGDGYIRIVARRSAVNEAFRVTNAARALGPGGASAAIPPTPLPTDVATVAVTLTHTATATFTDIPENTPVNTLPPPFSCDNITARLRATPFSGFLFFMEFINSNAEPVYLTRTYLYWDKSPAFVADYPNAYLNAQSLLDIYWEGDASITTSPTDTDIHGGWVTSPSDPDFYDDGLTEVLGLGRTTTFFAQILNGPSNLSSYMTRSDFNGSIFYFHEPIRGQTCQVELDREPEPDPPTLTPDGWIEPPTLTPDCASSTLSVKFVSFDRLGDVRLVVENRRTVPAPFDSFEIHWPVKPGLTLNRVVAGGNNAYDTNGVLIWLDPVGSKTSPTQSWAHGVWQNDYSFPPAVGGVATLTFIHLDFSGTSGTLDSAFGIDKADFNRTWFEIGCGGRDYTPGGGGRGGNPSGIITLDNPTPHPTQPPAATRTPGPTRTASNTPRPMTPTKTYTPKPTSPPTATPRVLSPTPSPIPTKTPYIPPTFGCNDGC